VINTISNISTSERATDSAFESRDGFIVIGTQLWEIVNGTANVVPLEGEIFQVEVNGDEVWAAGTTINHRVDGVWETVANAGIGSIRGACGGNSGYIWMRTEGGQVYRITSEGTTLLSGAARANWLIGSGDSIWSIPFGSVDPQYSNIFPSSFRLRNGVMVESMQPISLLTLDRIGPNGGLPHAISPDASVWTASEFGWTQRTSPVGNYFSLRSAAFGPSFSALGISTFGSLNTWESPTWYVLPNFSIPTGRLAGGTSLSVIIDSGGSIFRL
jgi:hypothetical protein